TRRARTLQAQQIAVMARGSQRNVRQVARSIIRNAGNSRLPVWFGEEGAYAAASRCQRWRKLRAPCRTCFIPSILRDVGLCRVQVGRVVGGVPVGSGLPVLVEHRAAHSNRKWGGSQ